MEIAMKVMCMMLQKGGRTRTGGSPKAQTRAHVCAQGPEHVCKRKTGVVMVPRAPGNEGTRYAQRDAPANTHTHLRQEENQSWGNEMWLRTTRS